MIYLTAFLIDLSIILYSSITILIYFWYFNDAKSFTNNKIPSSLILFKLKNNPKYKTIYNFNKPLPIY